MEPIHKITVRDEVLEIYNDECPMSPREWDNLGKFALFHKRYTLANETDIKSFDSNDELLDRLRNEYNAVVILPVYMYDHSGRWLSTGTQYPFNDQWDAGQVGYIIASKEDILKNFMVKRLSKKLLERTADVLRNEVKEYGQYINGEVYCYTVSKVHGCGECEQAVVEVLDSCSGFFEIEDIASNVDKKFRDRLRNNQFD